MARLRQTLSGVDADVVDTQIGAWLLALAGYGGDAGGADDDVTAVRSRRLRRP
jgi:hypothetical protein